MSDSLLGRLNDGPREMPAMAMPPGEMIGKIPRNLNLTERVLEQHQEIQMLRERVTNLELGIEKLAALCRDQLGLVL